MSSAHDPIVSAEDAERLLGSLAGVVSAHVVTDATGTIVEIHILSAADLHPKQMVRNVESALSAGLGIQIDRRLVSVAQIRAAVDSNGHNPDTPQESRTEGPGRDHDEPDKPHRAPPRLEFVRYESHRDAEYCRCEVTLRNGEHEILGTGKGPDTAAGRAEAAARAVFDGIGRARPKVRVELEAAVISNSRGRNFVIVAAHVILVRTTVPLAGAASLTRSPEEAAILASLQATNRWST